MAVETFKPGDIVYHKANNLRMVVVENDEEYVKATYINPPGEFTRREFLLVELSKSPLADAGFTRISFTYQLESKTRPVEG